MRRFFHSLICNDSFKCSLGELLLSYIVLSFYFTINWILVIVNIFMMVVNYKYKTIALLFNYISKSCYCRFKTLSLTYSFTYIVSGLSLISLAASAIIKMKEKPEVIISSQYSVLNIVGYREKNTSLIRIRIRIWNTTFGQTGWVKLVTGWQQVR